VTEQVFSEREGFAPQISPQADDYLPGWVREAITNEIRRLAEKDAPLPGTYRLNLYPLFRPHVWKVLGKEPPGRPMGGPFTYYIPEVLKQCHWYQCYDILEQIAALAKEQLGEEDLEGFSERINAILAGEGIPWKLDQVKVERRYNRHVEERIKKVHTLLAAPEFKGPDEQFAKAIGHLNRRPNPDEENCVKDAVGALEAVANIIAGSNNTQLNDLLKEEPFKSGIHTTIRQAIEKVYAYRGAAPGASHGLVGPSVIEISEAIWVLTVSAATILYLVGKFCKPIS
jgi:hypothetical protein